MRKKVGKNIPVHCRAMVLGVGFCPCRAKRLLASIPGALPWAMRRLAFLAVIWTMTLSKAEAVDVIDSGIVLEVT